MEHNILGSPCEEDNSGLRVSRRLSFEEEDDEYNKDSGNPEIGMKFSSEDQAYNFYNDYGRRFGFSIRKDWRNKNSVDVIYRRKLCCLREGLKKEDRRGPTQCERDPTRVYYKAHIMIALQPSGEYQIERVQVEHNHHCTPRKSYMLRSHRKVTKAQAGEAIMASSVGIPMKKTYDLITVEVGGPENIGFLLIDMKNYIRSKRMRSMEKRDAGGILQYLQKMVMEDSGFVYSIQLDAEDQINNIFWADSRIVNDYNIFGDVFCFDTTYRTNNQVQPFAPFVGVNHHRQTILFGVALMYDKTTESFEWVFRAFLNAISEKQLKTILTDQDRAMANAISLVFLDTYHCICVWHMYQNATKHLSYVFGGAKSFIADFSKFVYDYDEEEDFLEGWESMLDKYNLRENVWLQRLFNERKKWALVYGRTTFCANMKSTQRSEGLNNVLRCYLNNTHCLLEFFEYFERVVYDRMKEKLVAECKMTQSTSILIAKVPLLIHARNVYTPETFKLFQKEYFKGLTYNVKLCVGCDTLDTLVLTCLKRRCEYKVTCDKRGFTISCSCKKSEFTRILCGHVLRI